MKELFWLSWHRTPYNDYLFNRVISRFKTDLFFIKKTLASHPWESINETLTGVCYQSYFPVDWVMLKKALQKTYQLRIITGWNHPQMFLTLTLCALTGRDFAIWTDIPNLSQKRPFLKRVLRQFWLTFIISKAKYTLVTGGEVGVKAMLDMGCFPERTRNFPTVVDLEKFKPPANRMKTWNGHLIFISSGRLLNSHKGYDFAIRAFGEIIKRQPDFKFEYVIAGSGPDKDSLVKLIADLGLQGMISLIGWVEIEEMIELYHRADVFIHPSHFDPFPNVVMEAMACGLPVIGSSGAGSVVDRVVENKNGFVFNDNDMPGLVNAISKILVNANILLPMRVEARRMAEKWSVEFNLEKLSHMLNAPN